MTFLRRAICYFLHDGFERTVEVKHYNSVIVTTTTYRCAECLRPLGQSQGAKW